MLGGDGLSGGGLGEMGGDGPGRMRRAAGLDSLGLVWSSVVGLLPPLVGTVVGL